MYLKEIRAQGFKSFADKTIISLNNDITGIVGPNGSGKSNVVDAVRWVLGEQSVKSLRGSDNMTDVIFTGSKSRGASNTASVTLVFDNSDKYINIEFNEVSIKRRVYRDGTNEYFINNEKCRLKDVYEILMDTGIAKESFNIISQGKIDEILASKPNERRVMFEEAAGVLKYKKRKLEALRKLERTHDNMSRVDDIIGELELQVKPLKEQKEKAENYLRVKDELEENDIALIADDIKFISDKYKEKKDKLESIKKELDIMSINNLKHDGTLEKLKHEFNNSNTIISTKNRELLELTSKVEKINSKKQIILERKKYEVDDIKVHQNLIALEEKKKKLENNLIKIDNEVTLKNIKITEINSNHKEIEIKLNKVRNDRIEVENKITNYNRIVNSTKSKIDIIKDTIENNGLLPASVKKVLDNPKLTGIHNTVSNIIEVSEIYTTAINIALGASSYNIIVNNEDDAKSAISYLKNNNLGRATFYPLSNIKSRIIDSDTLDIVRNMNGFIGIASDIIMYNKVYSNIITNLIGNVIVVEDINSANHISRRLNNRYRVVTLDGTLLNVGGSFTGGSIQNKRSVLTLKYELVDLEETLKKHINHINEYENQINEIDSNYQLLSDKLYLINKDKIIVENEIKIKKQEFNENDDSLELVKSEIKSMESKNTISNEEEEVMNEYYEVLKNKELLIQELDSLKETAENAKNKLEEFEHSIKQGNQEYNALSSVANNLEIEINRDDVKLDNLLNQLSNDYNLTYELAIVEHPLYLKKEEVRNKVSILKRELKNIGMVNIDSIEEYDRVSVRYEFLQSQKNDLNNAEEIIMGIINEMDEVMERDFKKTFNVIRENFKTTFTELFKGGHADLVLTDSNNMLETGIDIIASPPGKKLTNISLLSGGEKTFTAISLLFAILKSRPVPFCILDEVEAALDDANVNSFGEYLKQLQAKTQFILITHKKRTMEFVDVLYGITMQESGVSKLVSVKLEDFNK